MAVPLFYYTSYENFECIYQLGVIWTSSGAAGDGVYLTELPPNYGRMTIADHLYSGHQDKYTLTEVCLETDSITVSAEKLSGNPDNRNWVTRNHLGLASFSTHYAADSGSFWKKTAVKNFIKQEHVTLNPFSVCPILQLHDMAFQDGLQPDVHEVHDGTSHKCIISVAYENAEGKGTSRQMAMTEAAKCLLHKLVLRKSENVKKETRPESLNFGNKSSANVTTNNNLTVSCKEESGINPESCNAEMFRNAYAGASASNKVLPRYGDSSSEASLCGGNNRDVPLLEINYNSVGALQEFCVRKGLPAPVYDTIPFAGNTGINKSVVLVKVGNFACEGISWSIKLAKKVAAADILRKLELLLADEVIKRSKNRTTSPTAKQSMSNISTMQPTSNPIGKLQEFCVANGLPYPDYVEVTETGAPHAKTFTVQCYLRGYSVQGTGLSKKAAKHNAALKMWKIVTSS